MMRTPAIIRSARGQKTALSDFLSPPVGGWNTRDALDQMRPTDAVVLENWFPRPGSVDLRGGFSPHCTGFEQAPELLMAWNGVSNSELFAVTATGLHDATTAGAIGAELLSVTSSNFSYTNFETAAGGFLVAVNGADSLKLYNGTTWSSITDVGAISITGVPTSELTSVVALHRRLWFTRAASRSAYYLPVASVGGALAELPLGQVFSDGGKLAAIGSWSSDPDAGQNDYTVFLSTKGEIALYRGTDPADASTFEKVGVISIAPPIAGHRSLAKLGGDLLILCRLGLFKLSQILSSKAGITKELSLTDRINSAFTRAVTAYASNVHWQVLAYPQEQALIVNIPVTSSYSEQYVMNTLTGAWARFVGWFGQNFCLHNEKLYCAGSGRVDLMWDGTSDNGSAIRGRAQSAYNYFGQRGARKQIKLISPNLQTTANAQGALGVDVDFRMLGLAGAAAINPPEGARWDEQSWDNAYWAGDFTLSSGWVSPQAEEGFAHSVLYLLETRTASIKLLGFNITGTSGGSL